MKVTKLNSDRNGKIAAAIYTIICLFFLFAIKCNNTKEAYSNEGVIVNLGFTETGKTNNKPEAIQKEIIEEITPQEQVEEVTSEVVEESITQETEIVEVTATETSTDAAQTVDEAVEEVAEVVPEVTEVEEVVEEKPQVDQNAMFPTNNSNPNQGDGNNSGDQGNVEGSIESNIYGDITSPGLGDNGKGWSLNGRSLGNKPMPVSEKQEYGIVTIRIKVGKNGKVINAQFTSKGSTTTDKYLVDLSVKESYKVTFNPDENAPDVQIGYVSFNYKPS